MKFLHTADLHLDREFEGVVQDVPFHPYKILEKIINTFQRINVASQVECPKYKS